MSVHKARVAVIGSEGGLGRLLCKALQKRYTIKRVDINCPNEENTFRADVRSQEDMELAVDGCDVVVHLAAFHGGYVPPPTDETRFDVNVTGTFRVMQACLKKGIRRVVWASSMAAMSKRSFYSITKVLGEDLCEYYHLTHGFAIAMLRYGAFTPCDLFTYGERILSIGVDPRDCVGATVQAIDQLQSGMKFFGHFTVMPDHKLSEKDLKSFGQQWRNRLSAANPAWPELIDKYKIRIPETLVQQDIASTQTVLGFRASYNFTTFLEELQHREEAGEIFTDSPRWCFEQGCPAPEGVVWLRGLDPPQTST